MEIQIQPLSSITPVRQYWNWAGQLPYVLPTFYPDFALDNNNCEQNPGNKVRLWEKKDTLNHAWLFTAVR